MEMILFTGCQGSGKTTFYKTRFFETHVRVNLDMIKTRNRERILIKACFEMKQSFVIDNTNPTKAGRKKYIEAAKHAGFRVFGYYFEAAIEDLLSRNAGRKGKAKIPEAGVYGTFHRFEVPALTEGFDGLYRISVIGEGNFDIAGM